MRKNMLRAVEELGAVELNIEEVELNIEEVELNIGEVELLDIEEVELSEACI